MKSYFVLTFIFLLISTAAAGEPAQAINVSDKNSSLVKEAEKAYSGYLEAERSGDIYSYRKYRSKAAVNETIDNLKRIGKTIDDVGPALKGVSKYHVDIQNFTFVRAEGNDNAGRLFYRRDWEDKNLGEMTEFLGFVVRLEEGTWKVDCVINSVGTIISMGNNGKPRERTMNDIVEHPCLSLR